MGFLGGAGLMGFLWGAKSAWGAHRTRTLQKAEEALAGFVRPAQIEEVPRVPLNRNTYFGSYRPPPPPPPYQSVAPARQAGQRNPNPGWGIGGAYDVHTRRPAPSVVGLMAQRRHADVETRVGDVDQTRFEQEVIRHLRVYFEGRLNTLEQGVSPTMICCIGNKVLNHSSTASRIN